MRWLRVSSILRRLMIVRLLISWDKVRDDVGMDTVLSLRWSIRDSILRLLLHLDLLLQTIKNG